MLSEISKEEKVNEAYSLIHVAIKLVHRIIIWHQICQCNNLLQYQQKSGYKKNNANQNYENKTNMLIM